jgi:hypothetical protein
MTSDDQADGEPDLYDDLARLAEELHATAEAIHAHEGWWAADDGVDAVHSIVRSSAHALRALAAWYDRCSERIFDDRVGAEQDATATVAGAERALRAFAADLEAVAGRYAKLVAEVDHLDDRDLYKLTEDELAEAGEAYAVCEVIRAAAPPVRLAIYEREDVARGEARARARSGSVGSVYRVVAVMPGAPDRTVAQWPGEGYEQQ